MTVGVNVGRVRKLPIYAGLKKVSSSEWRAYLYVAGTYVRDLETITGTADFAQENVYLISANGGNPMLWMPHAAERKFSVWTTGSGLVEADFTADLTVLFPGGILQDMDDYTGTFRVVKWGGHLSRNIIDSYAIDAADTPISEDINYSTDPGGPSRDYFSDAFGANMIPTKHGIWLQGFDDGSGDSSELAWAYNDGNWGERVTDPVMLNIAHADDSDVAAKRMRGVQTATGGAALVRLSTGQWVVAYLPDTPGGGVGEYYDATGMTEVQMTPGSWDPGTSLIKHESLYASPDGGTLSWYVEAAAPYLMLLDSTAGPTSSGPNAIPVEAADDANFPDLMIPLS